MIKRAKGLELEQIKIVFITHLSSFGSKIFLTFQNIDFQNMFLTKVVHIYAIEGMNA
jgi:hypothetical protein